MKPQPKQLKSTYVCSCCGEQLKGFLTPCPCGGNDQPDNVKDETIGTKPWED
jgi:hypothetical protein